MPAPSPDPLTEEVARGKAFVAEARVAVVRFGVVLLNVVTYYAIMGRPGPMVALADVVSVAALAYSAVVLLFEPYRRAPALMSSYFTTASDGALITFWIMATGGFASPWYVLWYVSLTAIAFRFDWRATLAASFGYALLYVSVVAWGGDLAGHAAEMTTRVGYIFAVGVLGALLSRELTEQTRATLSARAERNAQVANQAALVAASPLAIVALDAEGRVRTWNPAAERLFGWSADEVVGRPAPIIPANPVASGLAPSAHDEERRLVRRDGALVEASVSTAPVRDGTGRVTGVVTVITDITARKRAEEAVEAARRQAATREKLSSLGTLVAGVAHEINNPLMFVRGRLDLSRMALADALVDPALSPQTRAAVEEAVAGTDAVLSGVQRIDRITKSLKQVARAPARAGTPQDVNGLVESALTVGAVRLAPRVRIVRELRAARPVLARGSDLTQVFLNLVLNAADAVGESGEVRVRAFDEGESVVVEVEDSGPGIPESERAKIFVPFHTTKVGGTGLGLSVSYGIVEAHGGRLTFRTEAGTGTTFRVALPAAPGHQSA